MAVYYEVQLYERLDFGGANGGSRCVTSANAAGVQPLLGARPPCLGPLHFKAMGYTHTQEFVRLRGQNFPSPGELRRAVDSVGFETQKRICVRTHRG